MGVYGASTFHQGDAVTPDPHPAPKPTSCQTMSTIGNGFIIHGTSIATPTASSTGGASGASQGGASVTKPTSSGSGSRGGPSATNSNNSAAGGTTASIQGWERLVTSVGSALVFSLVGAAVVL